MIKNERAYFEYKKAQFGILWCHKMRYARRYRLLQIDTLMISWGMRLDRQGRNTEDAPRLRQLPLFGLAA